MRDELDHLGMYISHNLYSITASQYPAEHLVKWNGYGKDSDEYFCRLYLPELDAVKPRQDIPLEITGIIKLLEHGTEKNKIDLAHFLLDMSTEAKNDFCNAIQHALQRQNEICRMLVMVAFGEIRYCMFISAPGIEIMSTTERQDYVYSTILCNESLPIMWMNLDFDKDGNLLSATGKQCSYSNIPYGEIYRLKELSIKNTKSRIASFQRQNHIKVGRNEPCHCGSGKKYKKYCMKYE